ncbi:hypothetical protein PVAP13_J683702 [Panicum virgatum]|nr:hypothetical protein PVAP13_J683702 [Panicum virgatum]
MFLVAWAAAAAAARGMHPSGTEPGLSFHPHRHAPLALAGTLTGRLFVPDPVSRAPAVPETVARCHRHGQSESMRAAWRSLAHRRGGRRTCTGGWPRLRRGMEAGAAAGAHGGEDAPACVVSSGMMRLPVRELWNIM